MSTQPTNAHHHTDGFKPGRISRFQPSSLPVFQSSSLLALLAAGILAGAARGAEYWVTTTGSDATGDGSPGNPYLTISNAVAKAVNPGDIVTVSNGTYNISATIAISAGITVRSFGNGVYGGLANAQNTVVSGGHGTFSVFTLSHANAAVNGLSIRDAGNISADPFVTPGPKYGGGVDMSAGLGLVSECIISGNTAMKPTGGGGGVFIAGGTVSNCVITGNGASSAYNQNAYGNGIYMSGGLVTHCQIIDHKWSFAAGGGEAGNGYTAKQGGGVYMSGGTLRNCLVARNEGRDNTGQSPGDSYGGGVYMIGGAIASCTIVDNSISSGGNGGGVYRTGGTVTNSVIFANFNRTTGATNNYSGLTSGNTAYSCTTPALGGSNISGDPLLRNITEGDYLLSVGSPCIDAGIDAPVTWSTDMAGKTRIQGTHVDMGAYEYEVALNCAFVGSPRTLIASAPPTYVCYGTAPFTVQFTALAAGTNLTGLGYNWDFDGSGQYTNGFGSSLSYTFNTPGVYTPRLQVTNAAGEVAYAFNTNYVYAGSTHYVVTNNVNAAWPYTSWATAASNSIPNAINAAVSNVLYGSAVIVSNGTYKISAEISIANRINVRSFGNGVTGGVANASNTIVKVSGASGDTRVFVVTADATVDGFTMRDAVRVTGNPMRGGGVYVGSGGAVVQNCIMMNNGGYKMYGGGAYVAAGLVQNCIIQNNIGGGYVNGGGVYMAGGTVSNCIIKGNNSGGDTARGGGVYMTGGLLQFSQITGNSVDSPYASWGGGVVMDGANAIVRNCQITGNTGGSSGGDSRGGGGVYLNAGTVESCTIASNITTVSGGGGGIYRTSSGTAGTVLNCIVYNNTVANGTTYTNSYSTTSGWTYNCTTNPVVAGTGCISDDPLFANAAGGDYSLQYRPVKSPCIDKGTNQSWMVGALDLAGNTRKTYGGVAGYRRSPVVDMGAYEAPEIPAEGTVVLLR